MDELLFHEMCSFVHFIGIFSKMLLPCTDADYSAASVMVPRTEECMEQIRTSG